MRVEKDNVLASIIKSIDEMKFVRSETVPNIDLYMDQITGFMDDSLNGYKRYDDDKILTKTMINNYVKDGVLPAPVKKKYTKEHLLMLLLIYYLKGIVSIKDVESILSPLTEKYFRAEEGPNMVDIYDEIWSKQAEYADQLKKDITRDYEFAQSQFNDFDPENEETLKTFAFICSLGFEVYAKKQLIETLIDNLINKKEEKKQNAVDSK